MDCLSIWLCVIDSMSIKESPLKEWSGSCIGTAMRVHNRVNGKQRPLLVALCRQKREREGKVSTKSSSHFVDFLLGLQQLILLARLSQQNQLVNQRCYSTVSTFKTGRKALSRSVFCSPASYFYYVCNQLFVVVICGGSAQSEEVEIMTEWG